MWIQLKKKKREKTLYQNVTQKTNVLKKYCFFFSQQTNKIFHRKFHEGKR